VNGALVALQATAALATLPSIARYATQACILASFLNQRLAVQLSGSVSFSLPLFMLLVIHGLN